MRRIIILLVAMTLACQMQGQIVLYSPDFSVGNLYYRIIVPRQEVEVVTNPDGCVYYSGNIVVPDSVEHDGVVYKVTSIGDYVFTSASLSSISLPQGVRSIGINCFSSATIRGIFNLPDSLRIIKDEAFYNCAKMSNIIIIIVQRHLNLYRVKSKIDNFELVHFSDNIYNFFSTQVKLGTKYIRHGVSSYINIAIHNFTFPPL